MTFAEDTATEAEQRAADLRRRLLADFYGAAAGNRDGTTERRESRKEKPDA